MPIPRTSSLKMHLQRSLITRLRLRCLCMVCIYFVAFLPFTPQPCYGLEIISRSVSPTYAAVGDSVTLSCHFILAPEDLGVLDIEWSIKPSDVRGEETLVIWYAGNHIYDGYDQFRGRVQFVSPDPASGNASISITDLTPTDTNTYQCKVRKVPGISMVNIHLDVMETPKTPECNLRGVVELGQKVVLRCRSTEGSPPMWYRWLKESRNKMLPDGAYVDSAQGDLFLTIAKEDVLGTYICTAQNLVGMDTCLYTLELDSSFKSVTATAAVTVTVVIIIIVIFIYCYNKRKTVEDSGNEIYGGEMPPHKWTPKNSSTGQQVIPPRSVLGVRQEEVKIESLGNRNEKKSEQDPLYTEMKSKERMEEVKIKSLGHRHVKFEQDPLYTEMKSKERREEVKIKSLGNRNEKTFEQDPLDMDMPFKQRMEEVKIKSLGDRNEKFEQDPLYTEMKSKERMEEVKIKSLGNRNEKTFEQDPLDMDMPFKQRMEEVKIKSLWNKNEKKFEQDPLYTDMKSKERMEEVMIKSLVNRNETSKEDTLYMDMAFKQRMEEVKIKSLGNRNEKKSEQDPLYMDMPFKQRMEQEAIMKGDKRPAIVKELTELLAVPMVSTVDMGNIDEQDYNALPICEEQLEEPVYKELQDEEKESSAPLPVSINPPFCESELPSFHPAFQGT